MKAIVYDKKNAPETLVLRELEIPAPRANEVLVSIVATSVNAADYRSLRLGIIPKGGIFGVDVSGRVEACGKEAGKFKVGDEVFGDISASGSGGFAEFVCSPEAALTLKPAGVTHQQAAAVSMAAVTALQGLRDLGGIQPGQKVLIYGAGGGVGIFAVQLAKHFGADVSAVCSPGNAGLMKSLGAQHVIDYTREDPLKGDSRYDLILAVNGKRRLADYRRALTPRGRLVVVGGALSQVMTVLIFGGLISTGREKIPHPAGPAERQGPGICHPACSAREDQGDHRPAVPPGKDRRGHALYGPGTCAWQGGHQRYGGMRPTLPPPTFGKPPNPISNFILGRKKLCITDLGEAGWGWGQLPFIARRIVRITPSTECVQIT